MRYVSAFITLLLITILGLFASSNKEQVKLELFPLPQQITAPLYLIAFLLLFAGFLVGGFAAWNGGRRHRRTARQANKRVAILESDVTAMRTRAEAAEERAAQLVATQRAEPLAVADNPEML